MSTQQPGSGSNPSQHDNGAASVGGPTSGEAGASRQHETLAETGGSGGAGLTGNQAGKAGGKPAQARPATSRQGEAPADAGDEVVKDSGARGAQDTRSRQAGGSATGLGTPETGANQTPADMEHKK